MYKSLASISDQITEDEYRNDGRLHYSTLATYSRGGFNSLDTLFDRKETPSLTFGSAVDSLITGSEEEFNERFLVADFPDIPETIAKIVKDCFNEFHITHTTLESIPDVEIIGRAAAYNYQNNWKPETRAKVIKEKGSEYYSLLFLSENKTLINSETYNEVLATIRALKESAATKWYFEMDNPFDDRYERLYQLKWHYTFNGIEYSCMMDEAIVDHQEKIIYPIDLKTSSHFEYEFYKSFVDWSYMIQARLYFRIIEANCKKDEYFKDFKIMPYRFIVANKKTLNPLVWEFKDTDKYGTLYYGKNNQIECRDPFDLGEELSQYLQNKPKVPNGITVNEVNDLSNWLNTL